MGLWAVPRDRWHALRIGMTFEEVESLIGPPKSKSRYSDGSHGWHYSPWFSSATAWIGFDENGKMKGGTNDPD